jgi:putative SOS response-associated peptidase YedK
MCGRFILTLEAPELEKELGIKEIPPDWRPRYNIAPTQPVAVVTDPEARQIEFMRWGLIPSWAKDPSIGSKLINARAETVREKPSFRKAFQERRCLILADGFYEWQRGASAHGGSVPFAFRRKDGKPFAFAGLWEVWKQPDGEWLRTCTIITCAANDLVKPVHERMPVMLANSTAWDWLITNSQGELEALLKPFPVEDMVSYQVSSKVNRPEPDTPDILQPV